MGINTEAIPEGLKSRRQWVAFKLVARPGKKPTKKPINALTGGPASSSDPADWADFDDALDAYLAGRCAGIGYVFSPSDPYTGVDLDDCVRDGKIRRDALAAVTALGGYAEISFSGTGLHAIVEARLPGRGRCDKKAGREIYDRGRYFTFTGNALQGLTRIAPAQETITQFYSEWFKGQASDHEDLPYQFDPEAEILDLPEIRGLGDPLRQLIEDGEGMDAYDGDHSTAVWFAAIGLMKLGVTTETVLSILSQPGYYLADNGALAPGRRDGDVESGRRWLWTYILQPAKADIDTELSAFEDGTVDPEAFGGSDTWDAEEDTDDPDDWTSENKEDMAPRMLSVSSVFQGGRVTLPPREWVLGRRYLRKAVTACYGDPGTGKTAFTLVTAISIATGISLTGEPVYRPGPAWIINNEEPADELYRRALGVCLHYGVDPTSLDGRLHISSGFDRKTILAGRPTVLKGLGEIKRTKTADAIVDRCREHGIVWVSLDPLVSMSRNLDENSNGDMEALMSVVRDISDQADISVDLVHHTNKASSGASRGGGMIAGRGASSLSGAARIIYVLAKMDEKTAEDLQLRDAERRDHFLMDVAKGNYARAPEAPTWFRHRSVALNNGVDDEDLIGDTVGIPERISWEDLQAQAEARRMADEPDQLTVLVEAVRVLQESGSGASGLKQLATSIRNEGETSATVAEIQDMLADLLTEPRVVQFEEYDYRLDMEVKGRGSRVVLDRIGPSKETFPDEEEPW